MITNYDHVINTTSKMVRAARIFRMPVLATEQYPQGTYPHHVCAFMDSRAQVSVPL